MARITDLTRGKFCISTSNEKEGYTKYSVVHVINDNDSKDQILVDESFVCYNKSFKMAGVKEELKFPHDKFKTTFNLKNEIEHSDYNEVEALIIMGAAKMIGRCHQFFSENENKNEYGGYYIRTGTNDGFPLTIATGNVDGYELFEMTPTSMSWGKKGIDFDPEEDPDYHEIDGEILYQDISAIFDEYYNLSYKKLYGMYQGHEEFLGEKLEGMTAGDFANHICNRVPYLYGKNVIDFDLKDLAEQLSKSYTFVSGLDFYSISRNMMDVDDILDEIPDSDLEDYMKRNSWKFDSDDEDDDKENSDASMWNKFLEKIYQTGQPLLGRKFIRKEELVEKFKQYLDEHYLDFVL